MIAMAMVAAYLVLSLPLSIVTIVRPSAGGPRFLLLVLDTVRYDYFMMHYVTIRTLETAKNLSNTILSG